MDLSTSVESDATDVRRSSGPLVRSLTATQSSPLGRATLGDQLRRHSQSRYSKPAIVSYAPGGRRTVTTYGALNQDANRASHMFLGLGVSRGDRVAVMARNRVESIVAYYGALKIGAVYSGINVLFGPNEVAQQIGHLEPAVVVVAAEFLPVLEEALAGLGTRPEIIVLDSTDEFGGHCFDQLLESSSPTEPDCDVDEHDLAMIVYTSGTEAAPKGVMLPHRNYLVSTAPAYTWGLRCLDDDVWLYVMPFHTIAGIGSLTSLLLLGATLVLPASLAPADALHMIKAEQITVLAQTPTFFISLADHPDFGPETVGTIQRCLTYGGQVSPRTVDAWHHAAPASVWGTYWGQSELTQLGSVGWFKRLEDIPDQDPTWIGKPVGHLEVKVVDADGNEAERGELLCRTPSVMLGYYKDPEKTAAVLDGGWVHTGDIVRRDSEGNMFFLDRSKDMIKTGGYNVSSQAIRFQRRSRLWMSCPRTLRGSCSRENYAACMQRTETLNIDPASSATPGSGRPRLEGLPSRRDDILAAAAEYFADQGYHSAGMRGIADSVGIKGASLYNHFTSKEEILYAIALKMTRDPVEEHLLVLDETGTPVERLTSLIDVHLRYLAMNRVEHLVSLREISALTDEHRMRVLEYRKYYQRRVRDVIAAGVRAGEFEIADPQRAAVAVLDLMNGVSWWLRDDHDIEALVATYVDYIVVGILRHRPGTQSGNGGTPS